MSGQYQGLLPVPVETAWGNGKFHLEKAKILFSVELSDREQAGIYGFINIM